MAASTCCLRLLLLLAALAALANAKRGCSAFGHSCFGGHGKRSGGEQMPPELPALETYVFPDAPLYQPLLPPRGAPLPRLPPPLDKLPPPLRQWIESVGLRQEAMERKK